MEEETKRAIEDTIISAHLKLAHGIIKMAIGDVWSSPREVQAFFVSEGFLWFLQLIGCEPKDLKDVAGRIAFEAFRP